MMNHRDVAKATPGGQLSARQFNATSQAAQQAAGLAGNNLAFGTNGQSFREDLPPWIYTKVGAAASGGGNSYAHTQQRENADGTWENLEGGVAGDEDYLPLYEANEYAIAENTVVVAWLCFDGEAFYQCEHCPCAG